MSSNGSSASPVLSRRAVLASAAVAAAAWVAAPTVSDAVRGPRPTVPTPAPSAATTSQVPGRRPALPDRTVDLGDYAVGDGVTDDTARLNDALADLRAAGGGTLLVPDRAFRIQPKGWVYLESDIGIRGVGPRSAFHLAPYGDDHTIGFCLAGERVSLENLAFERVDNVYGAMLDARGNHLWVSGCTFDGHLDRWPNDFSAIRVYVDAPASMTMLTLTRTTVRRCGFGMYQASARTGAVSDILVDACHFERNHASDLEFNAPSNSMSGCVVQDCTFRDNASQGPGAGWGAGFANVQGGRVARCSFDGYPMNAVHVEDRSSGILLEDNAFVRASHLDTGYAAPVQILSLSHDVDVRRNSFDTSRQANRVDCVWVGRGSSDATKEPHDVRLTGNRARLAHGSRVLGQYGCHDVTETGTVLV